MFKRLLIMLAALSPVLMPALESGVVKFNSHTGYVYIPENFNSAGASLLLFFHGRGGTPGGSGGIDTPEFAVFRQYCDKNNIAVAVPGCGADSWGSDNAMLIAERMVEYLGRTLKMNVKKYFVMGGSMGGGAALIYSARHPGEVLAVCDLFGVTDLLEMLKDHPKYQASMLKAYKVTAEADAELYKKHSAINHAELLKDIPLLILHGDRDSTVKLQYSYNMIEALKKAGGSRYKLIVVPGKGHNNNIVVGYEKNIFDFFLANK